jgi:hypothetical protein
MFAIGIGGNKMRWLSLFLVICIVGCAAQPQTVTNSTSAPQPNSTTVASAANTDKFQIPSEYKKRIVGGETRYCRDETITGSRFPTKVCLTYEQLKETVIQSDEMRSRMSQRVCAGKGLCGE